VANKLSERDLLKINLVSERSMFVPGKGRFPICPVCKHAIFGAPDLHEAIITRGQVAGTGKARKDKIYSRYNCVLRHNTCPTGQSHTPGIGSHEDFDACLKQIIEFEGYEALLEWLASMEDTYPIAATQAMFRVKSHHNKAKGD
jgi:hypothetical protein